MKNCGTLKILTFLSLLSSTKGGNIARSDFFDEENANETHFDRNEEFSAKMKVDSYIVFRTQMENSLKSNRSSLCHDTTMTSTDVTLAGCIMGSLIPENKTYLVEFQRANVEDASVCWRTCRLIYPNTTMALIATSDDQSSTKVLCHCTLDGAIDGAFSGPDVFCNENCIIAPGVTSPCGGHHTFQDNGVTETFFSIFCLNGGSAPPTITTTQPTMTTTFVTSTSVPTTATTSGPDYPTTEDKLQMILKSLVEGNVMSIVIIGLIVCLITLILMLFAWAYLYVESLYPNESSSFYPRLSFKRSSERQTPVNPSSTTSARHVGYGTNNRAFDPTPEIESSHLPAETKSESGHRSLTRAGPSKTGSALAGNGLKLTKSASTEDDDAQSSQSEDEISQHERRSNLFDDDNGRTEGRSTFYSDGKDRHDLVSQKSAETEVADYPLTDTSSNK